MPNLRIVHDNAADRASIAASTTAGALGVANLKTLRKGEVHRSTGTSVSYGLVWSPKEVVRAVVLPATNLSTTATIRVRLYSASGGTLLADSGVRWACPGPCLGDWDWSMPLNARSTGWLGALNANGFAYGAASKAAVWFDDAVATGYALIDLVDADNPAGYIDCARIVAGNYWEPTWNAKYGATHQVVDTTKRSRNDAGDDIADLGTRNDALQLDLQFLSRADRTRLADILRASGVGKPVLLCLYPDGDDAPLVQDNLIYGRRANSAITADFFDAWSNQISMEGW